MTGKRLLLHICCGPCAIYPLQSLLEQGFTVVGLYYNPNIHPLQEYLRRRQALTQVAEHFACQVIYKDQDYRPEDYLRQVSFREENRCFYCYQMRLERTLHIARHGRFDYFSTTLLYSKFQKHDLISQLGTDLAGGGQVRFWYQDFRQGWSEGIDLSRDWGIYRQEYCGCIYSEKERYIRALKSLSVQG